MKAKNAVVPKLRFPEFENDWESVLIGSFFDLEVKPKKTEIFDGNKLLTVRLYGKGVVKNERTTLTGGANYFTRKAGQFIFSKIDLLNGAFGVVPSEYDGYSSSSDVPAYSFKDGKSRDFFLHWLRFHHEHLVIERTGTSNTLKRVSPEKFLALNVLEPSPSEQQKIADCLTSLDELIAAQGRKVEALKAYKRGLILKLFPREGETFPSLRIPQFKKAPGWVEYPLSKFAEYENGKAYEQDIHEDGKYVVVNSRYISTDGMVQKGTNAAYCIASEGDVLMVLSDLPKGRALAKCFYVDSSETYAVNQRVARLTPTTIHPKFLYYRLNRHPRLLSFDDGLNQTHLSKGSVTDCPLLVPEDRCEQERIADMLASLDAQVLSDSFKLEVLKRHKQSLMQQLFPVVKDV